MTLTNPLPVIVGMTLLFAAILAEPDWLRIVCGLSCLAWCGPRLFNSTKWKL